MKNSQAEASPKAGLITPKFDQGSLFYVKYKMMEKVRKHAFFVLSLLEENTNLPQKRYSIEFRHT